MQCQLTHLGEQADSMSRPPAVEKRGDSIMDRGLLTHEVVFVQGLQEEVAVEIVLMAAHTVYAAIKIDEVPWQ